jgi:hypothetical protein
MLTRTLGSTGLKISELGFGCASFWGKPIFDETEAVRLVHTAIDHGVNFFDTGSSYSEGYAEPRLGRAIASLPMHKKQNLIIATKAGTRLNRWNRPYKDFSAPSVRDSVEASLRRLGLDTLPLLQLHGPQIVQITDELLDTLQRLKIEGKILHCGVNSFDMPVIEHIMTVPTFSVAMIDYNILRPERAAIIQKLADRNFGVLGGMALAGGLYSKDRYRIQKIRDVWYVLRIYKNHRADIMHGKAFTFINDIPGISGGALAMAWVLQNPSVSCAVFGTTRENHLLDNIKASGYRIEPPVLERIKAIHTGF